MGIRDDAAAHSGDVLTAVPAAQAVQVDGDLSDWSSDIPSQPVALPEFGTPLSTPDDFCRDGSGDGP